MYQPETPDPAAPGATQGDASASPRARRVTIDDLARRLGLTKGTVSRALNGYSDISHRTRRRVAQAAEEMGYRPLAQAQSIRTGRTRSLGLVLERGGHDDQRPFLAEFLEGLTLSASEAGWTLTVATAGPGDEMTATLGRLIDERKADGFVLPRTRTSDPRIALLRAAGVPFVLYGRTGDPAGCAWYDVEGEAAMREAVLRLAAAGHRRVGYIGGGDFHYAGLRRAGAGSGVAEAGLPADPELFAEAALTREGGREAALRLWSLPQPPTALVCAVDMAALGVYRAAAELGLSVGRDVSVISYDGIPEAAHADPPLTTYHVETRAAGGRLAELLIALCRGAAPETLRETVRARLRPGGSDGAPRLTPDELAARVAQARTGHRRSSTKWEEQPR
ncbi:LacI family transcriptional regulator [Mesobaculum littorinae]|uniref:LacI family transcriptional regulator n=1 Tax=Mesobaculum littorinae TaxID=2486419 RepID=A0A438AKT3_9RHOB|nr:substrate-binding domain-containing protein [Mesobaculum littorinae]RVV99280.1 LacI family transcriptional regulator [Mesobaculum littorinae]